ncbi:ABC transporter ATP-binding protein [Rudaeicoccus suwonensis]|uniref:NitT/TauT family transport system ATP-binding protein n=1 Tax=Rudaeicoccus suwonensis TaxID=657409 RepID=A0A561E1C9_9MICO|nr:ABC transporter ATP-binding protein [Rudaeicoccus suwonensis]TWE09414.1 NitT/TauT family transport system ATP-binding protein [Rudaeicoccus suwonensis]
MMTAEIAFAVQDLHKVFFSKGRPVHALNSIDLVVEQGSFTCILGPSGCGKSTLLRILGGLEEPTSGSVLVSGRPAIEAKDQTAFVFQDHGVFPWLTVLDNVAFGLEMAGRRKSERRDIAAHWLQRVGMEQFAGAYPEQLSGGMRQRVAIARAFAMDAPYLLMDEPLGALDAQTRRLMQEQLLQLWQDERKTVVLVTHAIEEALLLGDRVVTMTARPGRIKEDDVVPLERPRTLALEADPQFIAMKSAIWQTLRDEVNEAMGQSA